MNGGLYSGIAAMNAAERRLEAVAANLANVSATGYKRVGTATQSFASELRGKMEPQIATRTVHDFSQGELRATGNTYDFALTGSGFFAVETAAGERYTRSGQFRLDENGTLLNLDGYPVAWEGARGVIDPLGEEPVVDRAGNVRQAEVDLGRLRIVDFDDSARLVVGRGGLFDAPQGMRETFSAADVQQGSLEGSNVSPMDEMVALISTQRRFESASRLLTMIEQSYRRLTRPR
jgi:flagellar basal-body rod protein FlgF